MNEVVSTLITRLADLQRKVAAAAQEPFMLGGRTVRVVVGALHVDAYVDGSRVSSVGRGYGVNLMTDDICTACGVSDDIRRTSVAYQINVAFRF